jgi:hypothetical protein
MKYFDGKRGLLRAVALAQVLLLAATGCKSSVNKSENDVFVGQALVGKDGPGTIRDPNTIVNTYSALVVDAAAGTGTVTVNNIAELATNLGTDGGLQPLAVGDLLLIIQMRGATMDPNDPNNATWGSVSAANLGNAGNYELAGVAGISGNVITLGCALKKSYSGATPTDAGITVIKAQVIRVAQYTTLTINSGASIIARAWNSTTRCRWGGCGFMPQIRFAARRRASMSRAKGFHGGGYTDAGAGLAWSMLTSADSTFRMTEPARWWRRRVRALLAWPPAWPRVAMAGAHLPTAGAAAIPTMAAAVGALTPLLPTPATPHSATPGPARA